jgi:hypothetical protein
MVLICEQPLPAFQPFHASPSCPPHRAALRHFVRTQSHRISKQYTVMTPTLGTLFGMPGCQQISCSERLDNHGRAWKGNYSHALLRRNMTVKTRTQVNRTWSYGVATRGVHECALACFTARLWMDGVERRIWRVRGLCRSCFFRAAVDRQPARGGRRDTHRWAVESAITPASLSHSACPVYERCTPNRQGSHGLGEEGCCSRKTNHVRRGQTLRSATRTRVVDDGADSGRDKNKAWRPRLLEEGQRGSALLELGWRCRRMRHETTLHHAWIGHARYY